MNLRTRGKTIVQQELGGLRTFASQIKHENQSCDEEEVFKELLQEFFHGFRQEMIKSIGGETADNLLNIFTNGFSRKTR